MRFVLDTNVLVHLANQAPGWRRIALRMKKHSGAYGVSAISAY